MRGIPFNFIVCGIIWAITFGFAAGNYACSLVHRLPRGRLILDKKPYCGHCGTPLQVRDLFPVISAVLLRHRCRYCREPFPVSHTWTELLVGALFVLAFLQYNFGEQFMLIIFIGVFLIILAAIQANEGIIMGRMLLCVIVFGALYRTLMDASIYGFCTGGFYGLLIGAAIWRKQIKPLGHIYTLPKQAELLAIGGICVGIKNLWLFLMLFAVCYALCHLLRIAGKPVLITVPFGLSVMLPVLYPAMGPALWALATGHH